MTGFYQVVCEQHEFVEIECSATSDNGKIIRTKSVQCRKCGILRPAQTSSEIIDKHIQQYKNVWEKLS